MIRVIVAPLRLLLIALAVALVSYLVGHVTADRPDPAVTGSSPVSAMTPIHHHWRPCRSEYDVPSMKDRDGPGGGCYWNARTQGNGRGQSFYVSTFGMEGTTHYMTCWFYPGRPLWNVCERSRVTH